MKKPNNVLSKNTVVVLESFRFVSGGMNTLVQCPFGEPAIDTVLSNETGEQWQVRSISHDAREEDGYKAFGILNVALLKLDPIGHNNLPKKGVTLFSNGLNI